MAGPAVVVVAGFITLWLAIKSNDGLVADDYYKQGIAINKTLARADRAQQLGLSAQIAVSAERIAVTLQAKDSVVLPERMIVTLSHPTRAGFDRTFTLAANGGVYAAPLAALQSGRWQITLADEANSWRLSGMLQVPEDSHITISPTAEAQHR